MLRQNLCVPLKIVRLLQGEAMAESATANGPDCPTMLHIVIVKLEWMPRMLKSITQKPQMQAEDPRMYLIMSHQRVKFLTKLRLMHLENNFFD